MIRGLFLNTKKARCSIHESGLMVFRALQGSSLFSLDYREISQDHRVISSDYDFYIFNYHHHTMRWLSLPSLRQIKQPKMTIVLESLPNNPFVFCNRKYFDHYLVLDPSMTLQDPKVLVLPRPLTKSLQSVAQDDSKVVVGTFGFPTPGKGFELVVEAVNREFDSATVRINVPTGDYTSGFSSLVGENYTDYLEKLCKKVAKPGVAVEFTRNFLDDEELINWCSKNSLNCFLYSRNIPGLSATTDQAIMSGRPVLVSTDYTFRHIHRYQSPYPYTSLSQAIKEGERGVIQMQRDWASDRFLKIFESRILDIKPSSKNRPTGSGRYCLDSQEGLVCRVIRKVSSLTKEMPSHYEDQTRADLSKPVVLVVSHGGQRCGVYQYGKNIFSTLSKSKEYQFRFIECKNQDDFLKAYSDIKPAIVLFNYYDNLMPWLSLELLKKVLVPKLSIMHEVSKRKVSEADRTMFDWHLAPDPTLKSLNPYVISTPRLLMDYVSYEKIPEIPTFGSFGFGFGHKGFEKIVAAVQNEYDHAIIRFHMPIHDFADPFGLKHTWKTIRACKKIITKPGIKVKVSTKFLSNREVLKFLSSNTANIFLYDVEANKDRGISSTIDFALAARRPIIINRCDMFRHLHQTKPQITIEDRTIREIVSDGIAPLVPYYLDWSEAQFILFYEDFFDRVLKS